MLQVDPQFYAFRWITLLLTQVRMRTRQMLISDVLIGSTMPLTDVKHCL